YFTYVLNYDVDVFNDILDVPSNASGNNQLPAGRFNRSVELIDRWRTTGDNSNIQKMKDGPSYFSSGHFDHRYESGSYLNLRDVSVGYNLKGVARQFKLDRIRASLQMTNIFTLSPYSGLDVLTRGRFGYPIPRTYKLNLSVTF